MAHDTPLRALITPNPSSSSMREKQRPSCVLCPGRLWLDVPVCLGCVGVVRPMRASCGGGLDVHSAPSSPHPRPLRSALHSPWAGGGQQ
uniref:Uncharacterized protein n=1 Tax=Knipowitschia caucasica TaxID=637954 RepID=A0AAV2KB01_KNICA